MIKKVRRACIMPHDTNHIKLTTLFELRAPWRLAAHAMRDILIRKIQNGEPLQKYMSTKVLPFATVLSARQIKSVYNQVYQNLSSWLALTEYHVRDMITLSSIPVETKTILYRLNKRRAWYQTSASLPMWVSMLTGEVFHSEAEYLASARVIAKADKRSTLKKDLLKDCNVVDEQVEPAVLKLLRNISKQVHKTRARVPKLKKLNTLLMDGTIAKVEKGDNSYGYWLRISTLNRGKPVLIPLKKNPYFEQMGGVTAQFVQLKLSPEGTSFILQKKLDYSLDELDTSDEDGIIGLDYGMTDGLFSDSKGNHYGQAFLNRMRTRDKELLRLTKALQSHGIKPRTNKRYRKLQSSIRAFAKNEINRLLNNISKTNHTIILEKLDFRNGGLSRSLNRLLTRLGRGFLKQKLDMLVEENRAVSEEVISAYSSQECSGCGFVSKANRKARSKFECGFCSKTIHADTNAARVIRGRRSILGFNDSSAGNRRITRLYLDNVFQARWGLLPVITAVNGSYRLPTGENLFPVKLL
jgi:putative transposase